MKSGELRYETLNDRSHGSEEEPGIGIAAVALTFVTATAWLHSHPLVLPLLSILLVGAAIVIAAFVAWRDRRLATPRSDRFHLAGLVIFFGFAAAIMGDPDPAVRSLESMK